eukprot:GHVS01103608.1.p1 GENE.GHVS01103608.1~~GHVS01103608.1.p1  ORF type:complete len:212 (+),score=43.96 GHVS01103608.1:26-637(+)
MRPAEPSRLWRRKDGVVRLLDQCKDKQLAVSSVVVDGVDLCRCCCRAGRLSARGLENAVSYFVERGHPMMVLVPHWLLYKPLSFPQGAELFDGPVDYSMAILEDLREDKLLDTMQDDGPATTAGRMPALSQRDVFDMVSLCKRTGAVLLSNNTSMYKEFHKAHPELYGYIADRQLMYAFDVDTFLPCYDMGRNGPLATELLLR